MSAAAAAELVALGFQPIPLRGTGDAKNRKAPRDVKGWQTFAWRPADWQPGEGVGVRCGALEGTRGGHLYALDYDAHHPAQDGPAHYAATLDKLPADLRQQLALALSTSRTGRYILFTSDALFPYGTLQTPSGTKAGEFLAGSGRQVVYVDADRWLQGSYATIPHLCEEDAELVLAAAGYTPSGTATAKTAPLEIDDGVIRAIAEQPELLEDTAGVPRGLKPEWISARLLTGKAPIANASDARYMVGLQLMRIGYAAEEVIGYLCARCAWEGTGKRGPTAIYKDAVRIVAKLEAAMPNRRVHPFSKRRCAELRGETQGADNNSRRGRGRPPSQPEQRLAAFLADHPDAADWTTARLADALDCTDRSIRRYRAALRGADNKSTTPETAILPLQNAQNAAPPTTLEGTCSPQPPACPPSAAAEPRVNAATAYRTAIAGAAADGRLTAARVKTVLDTYFPDVAWSPKRFLAIRDHWRRDRADDELQTWARSATPQELRRRARGLGRRHADAQAKGNPKQAFVFGRMAQLIEHEIDERQARGDWPPVRGQKRRAAPPPVALRTYATPIHAWYAAMRAGNAAQAGTIEARCSVVDWAAERAYFAAYEQREGRSHATG